LILVFRLKQTSEFEDGIKSISKAYQRTNVMAEINYLSRKVERIAREQFARTYLSNGTVQPEFSTRIDVFFIFKCNITLI